MSAPQYLAIDYQNAMQAQLPTGRVWPREFGTMQGKVLSGFAPTYARNNQRAAYLLVDAFPASADELLPEWEKSLGLPDPCAGLGATLQARQHQVVARLTNSGGQSVPYFIAYAASLGFPITVTEYAPFRADLSAADDPDGDDAWAYTWAVNAALNTIIYFRADLSAADEPLESWGNAVLECELNAIKPAHTILQFHYS